MDITEFLNRLAFARFERDLQARILGTSATYSIGDAEILASVIEVQP